MSLVDTCNISSYDSGPPGVCCVVVLGSFKDSRITDRCTPPFPKLANLDNKSAWAFCSLGTCVSSKVENAFAKVFMYLMYDANWGSFD